MPKVEVICLGELLIDFVVNTPDVSIGNASGFVKAPGGAPANVAVGVVRLGHTAGFIGKVGDDAFGHELADCLSENGVDVSALAFTKEARTTLVFVGVRSDGRKDMLFYRHPGADMLLSPKDLPEEYFQQAKIFHYGSISLIDPLPREATFAALTRARNYGLITSYDPNLRLSLWPSTEEARQRIWEGFRYADITKVSEEEWEFITGTTDFMEGSKLIFASGVKWVIISRGEKGGYFNNGSYQEYFPGFSVPVVETTGAGDGFVAAILSGVLEMRDIGASLDSISPAQIARILKRANAVGALTTAKAGAIPALPTKKEVEEFLKY
ncbi:MAG: PfkB family carbohydrate kinase [bacterium]|nr:PfkB family carbohydrate kinase [bacterium]